VLRRSALIAALLVPVGLCAAESRAAERPRVVVVKSAALGPYAQVVAGFSAEARANVEEVTLGEGAAAVEKAFKQISGSKPALVLAIGPAAAVGARRQFSDVPIVFVMVPYFQKYELDGQNVTGIALTSDLSLELAALKATWPQVKRVGVLADLRFSKKYLDDAGAAAQSAGVSLVPVDLDSPQKVDRALGGVKGKVDALAIISDKTVGNALVVERLLAFADAEKLPTVGMVPSLVGRGALLALSPAPLAIGQQAGRLANRILVEKIDPGALAVANPEGVELHVDLGQAAKLGAKERFAADLLEFAAKRGLPVKAVE
jgi:putative ABC transport system substrate-binding protein